MLLERVEAPAPPVLPRFFGGALASHTLPARTELTTQACEISLHTVHKHSNEGGQRKRLHRVHQTSVGAKPNKPTGYYTTVSELLMRG